MQVAFAKYGRWVTFLVEMTDWNEGNGIAWLTRLTSGRPSGHIHN